MITYLGGLWQIFVWYLLPILCFLLYIWYVRKFQFYQWVEQPDFDNIRNKLPRGKCPPSYPFGWYRLCRSNELKVAQVSEIKLCGRHIAYYRGEDSIVYAVDAYCLHMGANLGQGGKVKFGRCIECPFHGWTFDGKTGQCVNSEAYDPKIIDNYQYMDITTLTQSKDGNYIEQCGRGEASLGTYLLKEMKGVVYIWLHPNKQQGPIYDLIPCEVSHLQLRAESVNFVRCHIQEIPENGADIKHFSYVHTSALDILYPFIKLEWDMKTKNAADPDFYEVMTHPLAKYRIHQNNLYDQFLKDKSQLKFINVLSIDGSLIFFNRWKFHTMVATGFQLGSATVTLCVKSMFFEALFLQSIQPLDKFYQKVYHTLWTNGHLPYWASAFILYQELRQVLFDVKIWDQKLFSEKLRYNIQSEADKALLQWREWYSQYYKGCHEFEKSQDKLEW